MGSSGDVKRKISGTDAQPKTRSLKDDLRKLGGVNPDRIAPDQYDRLSSEIRRLPPDRQQALLQAASKVSFQLGIVVGGMVGGLSWDSMIQMRDTPVRSQETPGGKEVWTATKNIARNLGPVLKENAATIWSATRQPRKWGLIEIESGWAGATQSALDATRDIGGYYTEDFRAADSLTDERLGRGIAKWIALGVAIDVLVEMIAAVRANPGTAVANSTVGEWAAGRSPSED